MNSFFDRNEINPGPCESFNLARQITDKLVFDAYEYAVQSKKFDVCQQSLISENMRALEQHLLLELIYFEALAIYFENLFAQSYQLGGEGVNFYPRHLNGDTCHRLKKHSGQQSQVEERLAQTNWPKHQHPFANIIIETARLNLGRPLWAFSKFASICERGYLGCAASVSELLNLAGIGTKGSASVHELVEELAAAGWHKIKISDKQQFLAGDIVYGLKGEHAHIGIITEANKERILVCDNSSSTGTLKERTIEAGGSFTPDGRFAGCLYVLRAQNI